MNEKILVDKPIRLYYTLGVKNIWKEILQNQVDKIINSGLGEFVESWNFGINILDESAPEDFVLPVPTHLNPKIRYITTSNPQELDVYKIMINDSKESSYDYYSMYFHSKGVNQNGYFDNWRQYMEYFIIEKWKECVVGLGKEYDTCGPDLIQLQSHTRTAYYAGAMWWTTNQYLASLDLNLFQEYINIYGKYATEQFSCSNINARHKCLHQSNTDFYHAQYPEHLYKTGIINEGTI